MRYGIGNKAKKEEEDEVTGDGDQRLGAALHHQAPSGSTLGTTTSAQILPGPSLASGPPH